VKPKNRSRIEHRSGCIRNRNIRPAAAQQGGAGVGSTLSTPQFDMYAIL
jgi:hypothetical protein